MEPGPGRWCKFHKVKGHHIEDYYQLKEEINRFIHEGHLKNYVKGDSSQGLGGMTHEAPDREREMNHPNKSATRLYVIHYVTP